MISNTKCFATSASVHQLSSNTLERQHLSQNHNWPQTLKSLAVLILFKTKHCIFIHSASAGKDKIQEVSKVEISNNVKKF